jgi:hypothetical protein
MRQKLAITISLITLWVAAIPCSLAAGQEAAAPSLLGQLQAQYKSVKMGSDSNGPNVLEEGTVLAIQKGGILGVPPGSAKPCPSKYENGTLKPPGIVCTQGRGLATSKGLSSLRSHIPGASNAPEGNTTNASTRYFNKGEKVYPSTIAVDLKNEKIVFSVVACDTCNQTDPPTYYKGEVDFQFAAGYLEKADPSKVEDTIGEVFALDTSTAAAPAAAAPPDQPAAAPPDQPAAAQPPPAPAAPASIELGQTTDQVVAALGQPDKVVKLGTKQIYVYKDLKVTFVNGKVTDVQ